MYPLIQALTDGQYVAMRYCGVENSIAASANAEEISLSVSSEVLSGADFNTKYAQASEMFADIASDGQALNLWTGADLDLYESTVGRTADALRCAAAKGEYKALNPESAITQKQRLALYISGSAALISAGIAVIASTIAGLITVGSGGGALSMMAAGCAALFTSLTASGGWIAGAIIGAYIPAAVAAAALVTLLVVAVVYIYDRISDWWDENHPEYLTIPSLMRDYTKNAYVTYTAVKNQNGVPGDANAWSGKQWNAIYYTKDPNAGSPVMADDEGEIFASFVNDYQIRDEYSAIHYFGEVYPADLNTYEFSADNTIYIHYHTKSALSGDAEAVKGIYITDIKLVQSETKANAYAELRRWGYEVVPQTLCDYHEDDDDIVAMIGFKTLTVNGDTTDIDPYKLAVKDIRVLCTTIEPSVAYYYGGYSYGLAGYYRNEGSDFYCAIYFSCENGVGSPIKTDGLYVGTDRDGHNETTGYEPVNLFTGGSVFDLNFQKDDFYFVNDLYNSVYMFFLPVEQYPYVADESGEYPQLYVSGITYFEPEEVQDKNYAFNVFGLVYPTLSAVYSSEFTYFIVTYTANPYRAITDIRTYTSDAGIKQPSITKNDSVETSTTRVTGTGSKKKTIVTSQPRLIRRVIRSLPVIISSPATLINMTITRTFFPNTSRRATARPSAFM